jgi:Holliday junction resolvase RusA-like endonuclease
VSRFSEICQKRIKQNLPLYNGMIGKVVDLVIQGEPASKANSRKIVRFGKRMALIKSKKARGFAQTAQQQIRAQFKGATLTGRIFVDIMIHYESLRPDLDEALVLDAMQGIVYLNDRQIVSRACRRSAAKAGEGYVKITVAEYSDEE